MANLQPLLRNTPSVIFPPVTPPPTVDLSGMTPGPNPLGVIAPAPLKPVVNPEAQQAAANSSALVNRAAADSADLYRRSNPITPTTTLGKIGHVAANIGNVLGDIFAPGTMALIPGTQLNNEVEKNRDRADLNQVSNLQNEETQRKQSEAYAANLNSEANARNNPDAETPTWKPLLGGNGQTVTAPNGNIVEVDKQGNLRSIALPEGSTVTPKSTAAPHDAFHEWLNDPQKFEEFLKAQTGAKQTPAKGFGGFAGMYAAYHMLHDAYTHNPALLPVLGPMLASAIKSQGFALPGNAGEVFSAVPTGQPENATGTAIGTAMPEAPTGATRSRGQFAESVLPSIADAEHQISQLGGDLGPLQGRWLEFYQGRVGAGNPAYAGLNTSLHNIGTAWMRLHANSEGAREEFEHTLRTAQTPADLIASLNSIQSQANDYVKEGKGRPDQLPGNTGGAKTYKQMATNGQQRIGSNDGGKTWFDVKTGREVK